MYLIIWYIQIFKYFHIFRYIYIFNYFHIFRYVSISKPGFVSQSGLFFGVLETRETLPKPYLMVPNGTKWYPMVADGIQWCLMVPLEDGHQPRMVTHQKWRSARIKKLILRKLLRMPKNLGVDTFPDPVRHFGAPWRPFWILQAVRRCRRCGVAGSERVPPAGNSHPHICTLKGHCC